MRGFTALGQGCFLQFLAEQAGPVAEFIGAELSWGTAAGGGGAHLSDSDLASFDASLGGGSAVDEASLLQWLERDVGNLSAGDNVLAQKIEKRACEKFELASFAAAGHGDFFQFLCRHPSLGQLMAHRLGWRSTSGACDAVCRSVGGASCNTFVTLTFEPSPRVSTD